MNRVDVASDVMASVGYDATTAVLEVEFRSGAVYQYIDVPAEQHAALVLAASKGRFFNAHVRPKFHFRRVQ